MRLHVLRVLRVTFSPISLGGPRSRWPLVEHLDLIPVWTVDETERIPLVTTCVALSFALGESILFLVAAGATWRLFTKDIPAQPNRAITAYLVGVMASLGIIAWLMPSQGFDNR